MVEIATEEIGKMTLKNEGWFTVYLKFAYIDQNGQRQISPSTTAMGFTKGDSNTADPGDYGVPDGTYVWLYAFVVWGDDNEATDAFLYRSGNPVTATYTISGTTHSNHLHLEYVGAPAVS